MHDQTEIIQLAAQYFTDLKRDNRKDTEENLNAWLWFTCPAHLRTEVQAEIEMDCCDECGKHFHKSELREDENSLLCSECAPNLFKE